MNAIRSGPEVTQKKVSLPAYQGTLLVNVVAIQEEYVLFFECLGTFAQC
jgi:hypothetical protein